MKKGLIISVMLLALAGYAGAQTVATGAKDDQNKNEIAQTNDHAKYCSKDMKSGHSSSDLKAERTAKDTEVNENKSEQP